MSNIYDDAIKEVKNIWNGNKLTYPKKTIEALERAKKEHELLELYRERKLFVPCYPGIDFRWDKLNEMDNQIKELESELK